MLKTISGDATSVKINSINRTGVKQGGYFIDYEIKTSPLVKKTDTRLIITSEKMSGGQLQKLSAQEAESMPKVLPSRVSSEAFFACMLQEIGRQKLWDKKAIAYILLRTWDVNQKHQPYVSDPYSFGCPVQPVMNVDFPVGVASSARKLGQLLQREKIPYSKDASLLRPVNVGGASMLIFHANKIFIHGSQGLERAINCITYADTALGVFSNDLSDKKGDTIVKASGAKTVLEGVLRGELHKYFSEKTKPTWSKQTYVLWWDEHITIVQDGLVCEYSNSAKSYQESDVTEYIKKFVTVKASLATV